MQDLAPFAGCCTERVYPKECLLAVDIPNSSRKFSTDYWEIKREEYVPLSSDLLFIAWGEACWVSVEKFMAVGGKRVLILGEADDGCTLPSNSFKLHPVAGWEMKEDYEVFPSANTIIQDHLTVNERI